MIELHSTLITEHDTEVSWIFLSKINEKKHQYYFILLMNLTLSD
jgi:hypothetical protein